MRHGTLWHALALLLPAAWASAQASFGPGYAPSPVFFGPTLVPNTFIISAFANQPAAPPGSVAFLRLDVGLDKSQSLVVRAFGLPAGTYQLVRVGGGTTLLGSFDAAADGTGKLAPAAPSPSGFLDWFEDADTLQLKQDGAVLFAIDLFQPTGGGFASPVSMVNGARLIAVGDDLDARGRLLWTGDGADFSADLRLERLDPGPYVVEVGGESRLFVVVGAGGKASLRLSRPLTSGTGTGYLYAEGENVRVRDASGAVVLEAQMPFDPQLHLNQPPGRQKFHDVGDGAADGLSVDFIKSDWAYGDLKSGWLAWQRDPLGAATVTIGVTAPKGEQFGTYELFVGDSSIGSLGTADGGVFLQATFAVGPEVDLRGQRLEVREGFQTPLTLIFPQSVPAALRAYHKDLRKPHRLRLDLLNPGTDLDATGRLDWRLKKGVEQLQVVVRDLPAGAYDVVIDGEVVAASALVVSEDGGEAQQSYSTDGVLAGSLPLDFTVHGALEIRSAGAATTWLQQDLGD